MKGRRFDCYGDCGRRILHKYNPTGYCRKCQKKNALEVLKLDNKKKRELENE